MRVLKKHTRTKEAAKNLVDQQLTLLMNNFGESVSDIRNAWRSDVMDYSFQARGFNFKGTLEITDTGLILDIGIPFLLRPFEEKMKAKIERELDKLLLA